jgi:hypothetical protein
VVDPQTGAARLYFGALRGTPQPLAALAQSVARDGKRPAEEAVAEAVRQSTPDLDPVEHRMATAAVTRALEQVFKS